MFALIGLLHQAEEASGKPWWAWMGGHLSDWGTVGSRGTGLMVGSRWL